MRTLGRWLAGAVNLIVWLGIVAHAPESPPGVLAAIAWVPLAMLGSSLISGLLANRKQSQTQTPTLDPALGGLQSQLLAQIMQRMKTGGLPAGYEAGRISDINRTYDLVGQSQANNLTARGLGTSPVAGVVDAKREIARAGDIVRMQQTLPLLAREMQTQDFGLAQNLLNSGRGLTQTQSGNMAGGAASSLSTMLAYLYGRGAFGGGTPAGAPAGTPAPLPSSPLPGGNVAWTLPGLG